MVKSILPFVQNLTIKHGVKHDTPLLLQSVPRIPIKLSKREDPRTRVPLTRSLYLENARAAREKLQRESTAVLNNGNGTLTLVGGPYTPTGHVNNFQNSEQSLRYYSPHEIDDQTLSEQLAASGDQVEFYEQIFLQEEANQTARQNRYTPRNPLIFCGGNLFHNLTGKLCLNAEISGASQIPLHLASGIIDDDQQIPADKILTETSFVRARKALFDIPSFFITDLHSALWARIEERLKDQTLPWDLSVEINPRNIEINFPSGESISRLLYSPSIGILFKAVTKAMEDLSQSISTCCFDGFDRDLMRKTMKSIADSGFSNEQLLSLGQGLQTVSDSELSRRLSEAKLDELQAPLRTLLQNRRRFDQSPFNLETKPTLRESATGAVSLIEKWSQENAKWRSTMKIALSLVGEYTNTGFLEMNLGAAVVRPANPTDFSILELYPRMIKSMTGFVTRKARLKWEITSGGEWLLNEPTIPFLESYS